MIREECTYIMNAKLFDKLIKKIKKDIDYTENKVKLNDKMDLLKTDINKMKNNSCKICNKCSLEERFNDDKNIKINEQIMKTPVFKREKYDLPLKFLSSLHRHISTCICDNVCKFI